MTGKAMRPATAKDGSSASATEMETTNATERMPAQTNSKFVVVNRNELTPSVSVTLPANETAANPTATG